MKKKLGTTAACVYCMHDHGVTLLWNALCAEVLVFVAPSAPY